MIGWIANGAGVARAVGMGEAEVAAPGEKLRCIGLGSCLAVIAYDVESGRSALAHAMLPRPVGDDPDAPPAKYASRCVSHLASLLAAAGGTLADVRVALVGGSCLLGAPGAEVGSLLGSRNLEEARLAAISHGFEVVMEDAGGSIGRSVTLDAATGEVLVRTTSLGSRVLGLLSAEPSAAPGYGESLS